MDNFDSILSINNNISEPSNILFTKEDVENMLNIQGNKELYNLEIKEMIGNYNDTPHNISIH